MNFDPAVCGEIQKTRPAIIVSNDIANRFLNRVQVVPLTSQTDKVYPSETIILLYGQERKALANQLTTAAKLRLSSLLGQLSDEDLLKVEEAIRIQLSL